MTQHCFRKDSLAHKQYLYYDFKFIIFFKYTIIHIYSQERHIYEEKIERIKFKNYFSIYIEICLLFFGVSNLIFFNHLFTSLFKLNTGNNYSYLTTPL